MENTFKRLLSLAIALVMIIGMIPGNAFSVFAAEEDSVIDTEAELATALAAGGTVTLGADLADVEITITKDTVLDLGGYTLTDAYIQTAANVTIQNGSIKNTTESYPLVVNSGKLTVETLNIEASKSDRTIWLRNSGTTLDFNSGSLKATKGENNSYSKIYGIWVSQGATANINGGTIEVDAGADATAVAIFGNYVNTVNINGGKISTSGGNYSYAIWTEGDVTVTGGEIVTNEKCYGYSSGITYGKNYAINTKGDVTISGGTITTNGPSGYLVNSTGSSEQTVTITDVEFTNVLSETDVSKGWTEPNLIYGSNIATTIEGGEFNGVSSTLIKGTGSTLTVTGGSFSAINEDYVEDGATVTVAGTTYTKTENGLEEVKPTGTVTVAYTKEVDGYVRIWGEGGGNASESYELKLYADETLIATTTLNNIGGIIDGDVYVTWNFFYPQSNDEYWTTTWETGHPNSTAQPTKVVLYIDGESVAENIVKMCAPDDLNPVVWEDLGGVTKIVTGLEGSGTEADPYLINNLDELVWFGKSVDEQLTDGTSQYTGKYIKLMADIDLAGINWNPIGSMSGDHGAFKGIFDGNGHTISNLNVQTTGNGLGLFARTAGNAEIKNLTLNNVTVKSTDNSNYVGAVVGNSYASTKITNVHVTGAIDISGRGYIGGISGHGYVVMDNVSVVGEGTISSTFWCAGGILGYGGEGATNITNATVEGTGNGLTITSAAGGLGAIVGMAEDNNGTQPISGANLTAKNLTIATYNGAYGTAYANYALGYLYGGNPTSQLTGDLVVENVTIVTSSGEEPEVNDAVASVDGAIYFDLQSALDAAAAGTGNVTVEILRDINLTNVDWNPVTVSAPGYPVVTVNGNEKTITGLNDMLFAGTWAGNSGLIINDLTIADSTIENDVEDSKGTVGVGAFIGYPQASATITLNNCHLVDSTVSGGHWTGGLIGMAGGYNGNDGPVFMNLTITDCSVTGSTITGKGSAGGVIGHSSCAAWTNVVIENTTVSGNTITSTGSSTNKAGSVMGTIGAAGQETTVNGVTKTGGTSVSATVSDNTVTSGGTTITTIYGRQGSSTGELTVTGGTYDSYPIEQNVSYAAPAEGYVIADNGDGTYSVKEDPSYGMVAQIGETKYETLAEAFTAAEDGDEVVILAAGTYALSTSGKDITITGAVDGVEFTNIGAKNMGGANVTFNNVTFTYGNDNYKGLQHAGDLVYNNCTINGQVFLYGTSETFNNCTLNQTSSGAYNVWTYGAKEVNFNECTFNSAGKSVLVYNEGACATALTVTDSTFVASTAVDGKAAIEIDTTLMPDGTTVVINNTTATGFDAGSVSGNTLWNDKKNQTDLTVTVDGELVWPIPELPTATVTKLDNKDLTFALNFVADEPTAAQLDKYGDWYADFELTVSKDVTFNADGSADGYLSGQYDAWSENWVSVPFEDVTLSAGQTLKIMEYAAQLQGDSDLKVTYNDVATFVKNFNCGVYLDDEFMCENRDLVITLELRMYNPDDASESYTIGQTYTYTIPALPTASTAEIENDELTFAMTFEADEITEQQLDFYGNWYADFELTVNKDITLNADGSADGYLGGQYDAYSENWVYVPFEDVTLNANEPLKIMEYAAELMGEPGLKYTYKEVYEVVKLFSCGMFLDEEFIQANPDVVVTLELKMYNPDNEEHSHVIGETYVFSFDYVAQNTRTGKLYNKADVALVEAEAGDTVILLKDTDGYGFVIVPADIKLDLSGHTLGTDYCASYGNIVDYSEDNAGVLAVPSDKLFINAGNEQMTVKTTAGYQFIVVTQMLDALIDNDDKDTVANNYAFLPYFEKYAYEVLKAGVENTGTTVMVTVTWTSGETTRSQEFRYTTDLINAVLDSYNTSTGGYTQMFTLDIANIELYTDITFECSVISDTGVQYIP